jgi:hypothetical protein
MARFGAGIVARFDGEGKPDDAGNHASSNIYGARRTVF